MDGVLLLDKPAGMTSHDCVNYVRRVLKTKKVGHTGTLDPNVTGVLPICVGRATKVAQFLTADEKGYLGEVTLGYSTTTEDGDGEVLERTEIKRDFSKTEIEAVLKGMIGTQQQVPPMYSAVKVNGKKLYEYARAGIEVKRPRRQVTIYELELLGNVVQLEPGLVSFKFFVKGGKGLFVRTVAVSIGKSLGYPAHMSKLRRVSSGIFEIAQCLSLEQFENLVEQNQLQLLPIEEALSGYPNIQVDSWIERLVRNGVQLALEQIENSVGEKPFVIYSSSGQCLAVYEKHPTKEVYRSVRGFF